MNTSHYGQQSKYRERKIKRLQQRSETDGRGRGADLSQSRGGGVTSSQNREEASRLLSCDLHVSVWRKMFCDRDLQKLEIREREKMSFVSLDALKKFGSENKSDRGRDRRRSRINLISSLVCDWPLFLDQSDFRIWFLFFLTALFSI